MVGCKDSVANRVCDSSFGIFPNVSDRRNEKLPKRPCGKNRGNNQFGPSTTQERCDGRVRVYRPFELDRWCGIRAYPIRATATGGILREDRGGPSPGPSMSTTSDALKVGTRRPHGRSRRRRRAEAKARSERPSTRMKSCRAHRARSPASGRQVVGDDDSTGSRSGPSVAEGGGGGFGRVYVGLDLDTGGMAAVNK